MKPRIEIFGHGMRIITGLVILFVTLFAFTDPVLAKGPQSLIISGPGFDYPVNFMDADNFDLEVKLLEQTGLWYGTGIPLNSAELTGELGPSYTFTWVNAGPPSLSIEERTIIQYVYLDADGGPIIHTPAQDSLQEWGSGIIGWFASPGDLDATLAKLGVPVSGSPPVLDSHNFKTAADTVLVKPTQTGYPWLLIGVGFAIIGVVGLLGVCLMKGRILAS